MSACFIALFAASAYAQAGAVPSRYTSAVEAVALPTQSGPAYGIPADMGVGDEVVVDGQTASITRFRVRRVQGVRIPVAQLTLASGKRVEARPLADMVTAQEPPPTAEGFFADNDPQQGVLVIPREVRAGSEVQVDGDALVVVAVARNLDSEDIVVVRDDDGQQRALRVWWTW